MFYVLNFDDHSFVSCDNADKAEAQIRSILSYGHPKDSIEVINGFNDEIRMDVDGFRALCQEHGLFEDILIYDSVTAKNVATLPVDVMSPQEVADAMGKAVRDGDHFYLPKTETSGITEITLEQAEQIYQHMFEAEGPAPHLLSKSGFDFLNSAGKYYLKDGDVFVGIDYSLDYEGYIEEFESLEACIAWLNAEVEIEETYGRNEQEPAQEGSLSAKIQDARDEKILDSPPLNLAEFKGVPQR